MSANKRKREVSPKKQGSVPAEGQKKKQKVKRLSNRKKKQNRIVSAENQFNSLQESDSELMFDYDKKNEDIVLRDDYDSGSDSDYSDDVVIASDPEEGQGEEEGTGFIEDTSPGSGVEGVGVIDDNDDNETNELTTNTDYIGFGFESSEEENDEEQDLSDDGVISNDEGDLINAALPTSLYPWIKAHDHSKQKEIADWLTMEMKDFVNYISPSKHEITARNSVVKTLKESIQQCWPGVEVQVFGSFATDLYLPGSDIDMVVISPNGDCENRHKLYQLSSFLRTRKLAKDIEVIAGAKVPIIKFVDPTTNIHLDISFERTNGIQAAKRIRKWLDTTPGLREIVLVVKQFLRSRKLNNVHVGGLGGYSTIILCYHFLQLHPRISTKSMTILDNLGALLIEFFELYGRNFSYDNLILAIDAKTDLPKYLKKSHHRNLDGGRNPFTLVVQDPDDAANNITRSSYNLRDIKKAFGGAYQILVDRCYYLNSASYKVRIGQSILGDIIKIKGKERDFNDDRDLVVNHALIEHETKIKKGNEMKKGKEVKKKVEEVKVINVDDSDNEDEIIQVYSDATVDSENESFVKETRKVKVPTGPRKTSTGKTPSATPTGPKGTTDWRKPPPVPKLKASDLILGSDDSEDETPEDKQSVDKDTRRDYWRQKGLEL